jgi:hypothetical protein
LRKSDINESVKIAKISPIPTFLYLRIWLKL